LLLARLPIVVPIHHDARAVVEEVDGLGARSHLRAVFALVASESRLPPGRGVGGQVTACLRRWIHLPVQSADDLIGGNPDHRHDDERYQEDEDGPGGRCFA